MRTPMGSNGKDGKIEENCDKPWDFDGESLGFKHKDDEDIMKIAINMELFSCSWDFMISHRDLTNKMVIFMGHII